MALYRRHLAPGGIIAVHVSNQFLDLVPVVKQEADHARMKSVLITNDDDDDVAEFGSDWVLVTDNEKFLTQKDVRDDKQIMTEIPRLQLWTDDYNSVLPLLRWSKRTNTD
jgi:hypothetical protein